MTVFLAFNVVLIVACLLALRLGRNYSPELTLNGKRLFCALFVSAVMFPLALIFTPSGVSVLHWETAIPILGLYLLFCIANYLLVATLQMLTSFFSYQRFRWNKRRVIVCSVFFALVLGALWILRGTGSSFDFRVRQYPQIMSGEYDLMHTIAHTLLCEGVLSVWHSFHAIVLVQLLVALGVVVMLLKWGRRLQASQWLIIASCGFIIWQFNLLTVIIKDVPYALSMMVLAIGWCQYMLHERSSSLWAIGLGLSGVACFRYDGLAPYALSALTMTLMVLKNRHEYGRLIFPVLGSFICWVSCAVVLPWALDATPGASGTKYAKMAHVICDVVAEGGVISPSDMEVIEREIKPKEVILMNYHQWKDSRHPVISAAHGEKYIWRFSRSEEFHHKYSFAWALTGKGETITKLFLSVAKDNPLKTAKILLLNSQLTWNLPKNLGASFCKVTHQLLLFCGLVLLSIVASRCRNKVMLVPFVPFLAVPVAVVLAATTYEPRYLLCVELLFPILFIYTTECIRRSRELMEGV